MNNERGYWELVSPLPDCPAGTKGQHDPIHEDWCFRKSDGSWWSFVHLCMTANPAIFRWVPEPEPEPERVEWPEDISQEKRHWLYDKDELKCAGDYNARFGYEYNECRIVEFISANPCDAAAELWLWCKEKGYLE